MWQDLLLDLLSCEEASSLGTEVYAAHAQRMKMKRFLLKLAIAYKHLPTYHVKVRRCLGYYSTYIAVLRIHEILVRIRIRGSIPLMDLDPDPTIFVSDLQDVKKIFLLFAFLWYIYIIFKK